MVLVFEILGENLYRYMKSLNFNQMRLDLIKSITFQTLVALQQMARVGVIHCDLKPENILFTDKSCKNIKVIDFGSSCFTCKDGFSYV